MFEDFLLRWSLGPEMLNKEGFYNKKFFKQSAVGLSHRT